MGKIEVSGSASKEIKYDLMTIVLTFRGEADTPAEASEKVMRECEEFLTVLKNRGFDISRITLSEDKIDRDRSYTNDGNIVYHNIAERKLEILSEFSMKLINDIRAIIQKKKYQVGFKTSFSLSKENEVHTALLTEALKNAKAQAELMAQAIGQKVVGLISADKNTPKRVANEISESLLQCLCCDSVEVYDSYENSDELAPTTTVMSETIYTVWEVQ